VIELENCVKHLYVLKWLKGQEWGLYWLVKKYVDF